MGQLYKLDFPNGKAYLGISCGAASRRLNGHQYNAEKSDSLLYRAWRKYGEPRMRVLAVIENDLLREMEIKAIASYGTFAPHGYNLTRGGDGSLGRIKSMEERAKLSMARRGMILPPKWRANISAAQTGKLRGPHTAESKANIRSALNRPEVRAKISAAGKGRAILPITREKLSKANRGYVHSPEARKKMSAAAIARTPEVRTRMSMAQKGKTASPETRAKLSAFQQRRSSYGPHTSNAKANMSAAQRNRSPEWREKQSTAHIGKALSREHRDKIRAGMNRYFSRLPEIPKSIT